MTIQALKIRDLQIGNFRSNRISSQIGGYDSNLESNRRIVVYSFNVNFFLIAI